MPVLIAAVVLAVAVALAWWLTDACLPKEAKPTLTPPPRLKGVDLKLRVVRYTQPDMWVSPLYWGHLIMCHACGLSFRVEMGPPHGWIRCPKCYTEERAALVIEEWKNRVIHKDTPPVEAAP